MVFEYWVYTGLALIAACLVPSLGQDMMFDVNKQAFYIDMDNMITFDEKNKENDLSVVYSRGNEETSLALRNALPGTDCDDVRKIVNDYLQRYINLFLRISELKEMNTLSTAVVDLEFTITADDLLYLQSFSDRTKPKYFKADLSRIDAILSEGLSLKGRNNIYSAYGFIYSVLSSILLAFSWLPLNLRVTLAVSLVTFVYLIFRKASKIVMLIVIINNCIFSDGVCKYFEQLQLSQINDELKFVKSMEEKVKCDEVDSSIFSYFNLWSYMYDPCKEYLANIRIRDVDKVSLFDCIIDSYTYYFTYKPYYAIGSALAGFSSAITKDHKWFVKAFTEPIWMIMAIFFTLAILVTFRLRRLYISFFGARIHLNLNDSTEGEVGYIGRRNVQDITDLPHADTIKQENQAIENSEGISRAICDVENCGEVVTKRPACDENETPSPDTVAGKDEKLSDSGVLGKQNEWAK